MKRKDLSVGMTVAVVTSKYGTPAKGVVLDTDRWVKKPYYMVYRGPSEKIAHNGVEYTVESTSKRASQYDTGGGVLVGYEREFFSGRNARTTPLAHIVGEWEPYIAEYNAAQERARQREQEKSDRSAHLRGEIRAALGGMGIDPDDPGVTIHHSGEEVTLARRLLP